MTEMIETVTACLLSLRPLHHGGALWIDAAGTLLHPAEPVAQTYATAAATHGVTVAPREVSNRFSAAMRDHRSLRLNEPSWRRFWRAVVADTTGSPANPIFETLYERFAEPDAWVVAPDGIAFLEAVRARGAKIALISNWDTRLRPLLEKLGLLPCFETVLVSGEEGVEKPSAEIFERAAQRLQIPAERSVMIGDHPVSDIEGARSVGASVIQIGRDFKTFDELTALLG